MARGIPILICGERFATQVALKKRVQAILNRGVGLVSFEDLSFVLALFDRHPSRDEKFGVGIANIGVSKAMPYGTLCFQIERTDGTRTDISYVECIKPSTPAQWFRGGCRTAVVDQIAAAKNFKGAIPCPFTGEMVTRESCHVDHAPPWIFEAIVLAYIAEHSIDVNHVIYVDGDGVTESVFAHDPLVGSFAMFHRARASLRVVSRMANLSLLRRSAT